MRSATMFRLLASLVVFSTIVVGVADTDEYRDADLRQSSYFDNHNMDPAVVDSSQFGLLWKVAFNPDELFYAKPLIFTPNGGTQLIFLASSQNWIRTLDTTGTLLHSRQVQKPFPQAYIGCSDIPNAIGIIGTPTIDPKTEIAYFFAKSYIPNYRVSTPGTYNGVYYFYAVYLKDLTDVPGFPILVDGSAAENDPRKVFVGGTILQRPSVTQVGRVVYGAFGGHCDQYNYTGTVLGIDLDQKAVVTNFAVESGPNSVFTGVWSQDGGGGLGGVWQAGMGLSSDGDRIFFATGNGGSGENQASPASGQSGCRTLGEAVVKLGIDTSTGKLSLVDYFQPFDYVAMDNGDQDFGSGGVTLLDPATFNGTGVARIAITSGKNGKIYILNADNLGGYKQGQGQTDAVIQTIATNNAIFGGVGSYPLEGGYVFSNPIGQPTSAYKLGFNNAGVPVFSLAGVTTETSAGRVGAGVPVVTSFKGRAGTGILWSTDPDAGLRAWYAVPNSDQTMTRIQLPQIGGANKFQRPTFGNGIVLTTDASGVLYCLGSPVNLPLNCTSIDFGNVALGSRKTKTLSCTALVDVSVSSIHTSDLHFVVDPTTIPSGTVIQGASFSLNVTWNLVNVTVKAAVNASYGNTSPGVKTAALTFTTTNSVQGYAGSFPVGLTGNEVSSKAFLSMAPPTVAFGGLVLGLNSSAPTSSLSFTIANLGQSPLQILGYAYSNNDVYKNASFKNDVNSWDLGPGFSAPYLPPLNGSVAAGQQVSIQASLNASNGVGDYVSYFTVWSSGGKATIILEGEASTRPIANFSISASESGWLPSTALTMDFGLARPGQTVLRKIRICNQGGSVLVISKSKPPLGVIQAQNYGIDLHEAQQIPVQACAYGTVAFSPRSMPPNVPDFNATAQWTLNVDDPTFGVHVVSMIGRVHDNVVGPTYSNGSAIFEYLGCYLDNSAGTRLLPSLTYTDSANNTNGECQAACRAGGYAFAGSEYQSECWCGSNVPSGQWYAADGQCTYPCPGDSSQACGGNGGYLSIYYDSTKFTPNNQTYNASVSSGPVAGPQTVNASGPYHHIGCYSEGLNGRALSDSAPASPSTGGSVEYCESQCAAGGFRYFGVEYGTECYCGQVINAGSVLQSSDSVSAGCNMACIGNSFEYCGGSNRLNMYALNGTLPSSTNITGGQATSTNSGASGPTQTTLSCPGSNSTYYTALSGSRYLIECGIDHAGGDMSSANTQTFEACIAACDATPGCVDISLSGTSCYLKSSVGAAIQNGGILGARLVSASTSTTTSALLAPTNTTGSSISTTISSSVTISSTSVSSSPSTTQIPLSCPASNSTIYTSPSGSSYLIECGIDHAGGDLSSTQVNTLEACISACDSSIGCLDVSMLGAGCYLKSTLGSAVSNGAVLGAKLLSKTSTPPTVSTSSSITYTTRTSATSTTAPSTVISSSSSTSFSSTSIIASSTTMSSTSPAATQTAPSCPASNSTTYTAINGLNFTIECGIDHFGGDQQSISVASSQACIEACSTTSGCVDVSLSGVACYLKSTLGAAVQYGGVLGARLLPNTSSDSNTTVPSSASSTTASNSTSSPLSKSSMVTVKSATLTASSSPLPSTSVTSNSSSSQSRPVTSNTSSSRASSSSSTLPSSGKFSSSSTLPSSSTLSSSSALSSSTSMASSSTLSSSSKSSLSSTLPSSTSLASSISLATSRTSFTSSTLSSSSTSSFTSTPSTSASPTAPPKLGNYTYQGCWNDSVSARALQATQLFGSSSNPMTLEKCLVFCSHYTYFGVEYAQECYCSNAIFNNSQNQTTNAGVASCNMACAGAANETCGGGNRLTLYYYNASVATGHAKRGWTQYWV